MGKLKLRLLNPQGNFSLPVKTQFNVEVVIETDEEANLELIFNKNHLITDINKKIQIVTQGKSKVNWKLITLKKTKEPSIISIKAISNNLVQMVQFELEIL